jgi:hypothetical protein
LPLPLASGRPGHRGHLIPGAEYQFCSCSPPGFGRSHAYQEGISFVLANFAEVPLTAACINTKQARPSVTEGAPVRSRLVLPVGATTAGYSRLSSKGESFLNGIPHRASAPHPCFVTAPIFNIRVNVHINRRVMSCRSAPSPMSRFFSLIAWTAISSAVTGCPLASRNAVWHRLVNSPVMKCADRWNRLTSRLARRRFGANRRMAASICITSIGDAGSGVQVRLSRLRCWPAWLGGP